MFESSFPLAIKAILINILVPLIPGILFLWIFFGTKLKGILLYILARAVGTGVVAFSLFNFQFIRFWIGMGEYFVIIGILLAIFIVLLYIKKLAVKEYLNTLKIHSKRSEIKESYTSINKIQKVFFRGWTILGLGMILLSLIRTTNLPTYADDSFFNWNGPTLNIYHDGGVKMFGDKTEILGRGRLGYPIYIPIYKAVISDFMWWFNDIYINLRQCLAFLALLLFVVKITRDKTKDIFYTILPVIGICWLPLVFFHAGEWYMELPSAVFSVLTIRAFYEFLEKKDYSYIALGVLLWSILWQIKNDGFVVYLPWILISFLIILLIRKNLSEFFTWFAKSIKNLWSSIFYVVWFLLPFLLIRMVNHIWLNPVATNEWWVGISKVVHREIFSQFPPIFMQMDNYNVALILLFVLVMIYIKNIKHKSNNAMLLLSWWLIILIFVLAFLLTENYIFVMNQTTVNRVFTMCLLIPMSFIWIITYKNAQQEDWIILNK